MFKNFKIKTAKEIGDEWKENWEKFVQGFNDFFGINSNQNMTTEHTTKETAFDITPEELRKNFDENGNVRADIAIIENDLDKPSSLQLWDDNWRSFTKNMMNSFNDMKQKANEINKNNFKKIEEQINLGKENYNMWLEKNEIKNTDIKEQQKLALQRFKEWSKTNQENIQLYFENQRKEWQSQIEYWKTNAQKMPEKWLANREKMRKDYEEWIGRRRKRSLERMKYRIEKANLRRRLQLRKSFNMFLFFLPIIIVVALVIALINSFNN